MDENQNSVALSKITKSAVGSYVEETKELGFVQPFANAIKVVECTRIANTSKTPCIETLIAKLKVGEKLYLVREIGNLADAYAIKIETKDHEKLGYVPCDCNELIARMIDGDKIFYAEILSISKIGPWNKIDVAIYLDD